MAIILLIKTEDGQVTELPILDKIKIGRSGASDFKILDSKMSGLHCSFEVNSKGELIFKDLESTNGSFLNNSKITQTIVRINDTIKIGNTLISIDETKLNPRERSAIGASNLPTRNDKTLPEMNVPESTVVLPKIPKKKIGVSLNKGLKEKKPLSDWTAASDNIIDQEESSGFTKMLTIDKNKKKK
jgi:pSer/pThr/pTyr-binding forkhead associated (FHA) protein